MPLNAGADLSPNSLLLKFKHFNDWFSSMDLAIVNASSSLNLLPENASFSLNLSDSWYHNTALHIIFSYASWPLKINFLFCICVCVQWSIILKKKSPGGGALPWFLYSGVPFRDLKPHPSIRCVSAENVRQNLLKPTLQNGTPAYTAYKENPRDCLVSTWCQVTVHRGGMIML